MDTHNYRHTDHSYECLCAVDAVETFSSLPETNTDWLFGHFNFEEGYPLHDLIPKHRATAFNRPGFFTPRIVLYIRGERLFIESLNESPSDIFSAIEDTTVQNTEYALYVEPLLSKSEYISIIEKLKAHILRGDCYEINFCQEFSGSGDLDPVLAYQKLVELSPTPFSCFYKAANNFLLCASPERFFKRSGSHILSEPIKGTIKRDLQNSTEDERLKEELHKSEKDKAENVMVVDLVRNDMSKLCKEGSVTVTELFHIYSFPQVHQMISRIEGELNENVTTAEVIDALFPMGSMTGAPKKRVLELINEYEVSARGIYSGTVGYIDPLGNADFNVVIRSIVYDSGNKKASYHVGGGITFYSDPEKEYDECMLKASAMKRVLEGT